MAVAGRAVGPLPLRCPVAVVAVAVGRAVRGLGGGGVAGHDRVGPSVCSWADGEARTTPVFVLVRGPSLRSGALRSAVLNQTFTVIRDRGLS